MRFFFRIVGLAVLCLVAYLLLWPVSIRPVAWEAPKDAGYAGVFEKNEHLSNLELVSLDGREGPEDVDIGPDGLIYAATHSGEIMRIGADGQVSAYANTQGRPLGIEFGPEGTLYVADGYRGLLAIDKKGTVTLLASETSDGSPILFADDVDVAQDGTVYFSDASTRFSPAESGGAFEASVLDLIEHSDNGRVLKYDPVSRQTTVFAGGLTFANGVAISDAGDAIYVVETGAYRVWRYPADGSQGRVILENLPGFPDNINNAPDGTFWVGLVSPRNELMDSLSDNPFLRKVIMRLPEVMKPAATRHGFIFRMKPDGEVIETLQDPSGAYALTTGAVTTRDGRIVVTSITEPLLGILP